MISYSNKIDYNASKSGLYNAYRIARTEGHRIQQSATYDAQKAAKAKGADVVKQWDSTLDGRTRDTHRKLDGQIREVDEPFEVGGKKAMMPGDFGRPEEDINCRCVSLTRAKWALDDDELETLKERAAFFELDKTKDFEDFKEKYLKAAKDIEQSEKSARMKAKDIGIQFFANKSIAKQSDKQLAKSVSSWKTRLAEHEEKINNPAKYDKDWDSKTEIQKPG